MRVDIDLSACASKCGMANIWVSPYYGNIHHVLFSLFLKFCLFFKVCVTKPPFLGTNV